MKISAFLMLLGVLQVFAKDSYSQATKLSLSMTDASIEQVLETIEDQSEFFFLYNHQLVDVNRKVDVIVVDKKINRILTDIFKDTDVHYMVMGRQIILSPRDILKTNSSKTTQAQQTTVEGTITDKTGNTIPGVNILIKGTQRGSVSDIDGNYKIEISDPSTILEFSFVGYESQEIQVDNRTLINLTLIESAIGLEEVVTVGYGTQKKVNLTGAVDVIASDDLVNRPVVNASQALQGLSPNLNITVSHDGGEPGISNPIWNIRGTGSLTGNDAPLILVDGVQMNINDLDPSSIESVSVLKDAAASAIYGARAPFGVVLITTKTGKTNQKIQISYNNNFSFETPLGIPDFANSMDFVTAFNQAADNSNTSHKFPEDQVERIRRHMLPTSDPDYYAPEYDTISPPYNLWRGRHDGNANNNWMDLYFKDYSVRQYHNINLSGGDDVTKYYIALGSLNQDGLYNWATENYKRNNILANITSQATDWLKFNLSTKYAKTSDVHPRGIFGLNKNQMLHEMSKFWPTTPSEDIYGTNVNPFVELLGNGGLLTNTKNNLVITLGGELEPVKGWKTNISYNYNYLGNESSQHDKKVLVQNPNGSFGNIGHGQNGFSRDLSVNKYSFFNVLTSYEKSIGSHYFKAMVGYEQEYNHSTGLYGSRMQLITNEVPSISTATSEFPVLDDRESHWATQAVFSRVSYNFKEKYLIEFNGRYNGSSRFQEDSRWGFYPSLAVGYNISKEDFWSPLEKVINNLKIRGSYGSLGNQNVPNYLYISTLPIYGNHNWILDGIRPLAAGTPSPISSSLTWETVTTTNIGIDAGLLNNRLGVVFDVYNRNTSDMFGPSKSLPSVFGASTPKENNASLSTKGWELVLTWRDRVSSDFNYDVRLIVGDHKSTVTEYMNEEGTIDDWYNDKSLGEIWGYTTDGFIKSEGEEMPDQSKFYNTWGPGDLKMQDLDGNDTINDGNRTLKDHGDLSVIGNTTPRYNVGISAGFDWKGFDFNMFWQGVGQQHFYVYYGSYAYWFYGRTNSHGWSTVFEEHLDYWRPTDETNRLGPNTDAYYPKPYSGSEQAKNMRTQSKYLQNAAYLRLKNIQIGYTIPRNLSQKVYIQKLRIYVSGENLLTITKLTKLLDPETAVPSSNNRYSAGKIYPITRGLSFGINVTF